MITAQDIHEKTFKPRLGGYDIASVDKFLDELAEDVAAYQEEIDTLKREIETLEGRLKQRKTASLDV